MSEIQYPVIGSSGWGEIMNNNLRELDTRTGGSSGDITGRLDTLEDNITQLNDDLTETNDNVAQLSNPNLLINGNFQVWQRGTSFSCTSGVQYTADRWAMWTDGTPTISQEYGGYSLRWVGSGNDNLIQMVELPKSNTGKDMTLSFLVNAPTGVDVVAIVNNATTVKGNQTEQVSKIFSGIGVWQKCVLNVPSNVTKSYIIRVQFVIGSSGKDKTMNIANVKLEIGSIATPFVSRSYGEELALCQRYLYKIPYMTHIRACRYQSNGFYFDINHFTKNMRITPTINLGLYDENEAGDWYVTKVSIDGAIPKMSKVEILFKTLLFITTNDESVHNNSDACLKITGHNSYLDSEIY